MTEENKDIESVEKLTEIESLEKQGLVMRNLKTKDLPKMMSVIKKADANSFVDKAMTIFNNEVSESAMRGIEDIREYYNNLMDGKEEDEVEKLEEKRNREINVILNEEQVRSYTELATSAFSTIIENYGKVYNELNSFIASLYSIKQEQVENLDLDVFINCLFNLKNQDKLVNFLKTVLKQTQ